MDKFHETPDFAALTVKEIEEYLLSKEVIELWEEKLLRKDNRRAVQNLLDSIQRRNNISLLKKERFQKMQWKEASLQKAGYKFIAGVDEVGRGPLAGPVVAAAVVLDWSRLQDEPSLHEINDSKKMTNLKREKMYTSIINSAISIGLGMVEAPLIDRINIYQASLEAMKKAVYRVYPPLPQFILSDGFALPGISIPQEAVKGGDANCISIAAASIVAKVTRDKLMERYHKKYPGYGFAKNKGYPTSEHKQAIKFIGPSPLHRRSFNLK